MRERAEVKALCPICRGRAHVVVDLCDDKWHVECSECGIRTPYVWWATKRKKKIGVHSILLDRNTYSDEQARALAIALWEVRISVYEDNGREVRKAIIRDRCCLGPEVRL